MDASIDIVRRIIPSSGSYFMVPTTITGTTWNPSDKSADITLSNGNLTANITNIGGGWRTVRATTSKSSGKYYFEITLTTTVKIMLGVCDSGGNLDALLAFNMGNDGGGFDAAGDFGASFPVEGAFAQFGAPIPTPIQGDTFGIAIDLDSHAAFYSYNGSFINMVAGSDPVAEVNPSLTWTGTLSLFPAVSLFGDTTRAATLAVSALAFSPPTGYSAWG